MAYSPHGTDDLAKKSRSVMAYLKQEQSVGDPPQVMSSYISLWIKNNLGKMPSGGFFDEETSLVPVPKSSLISQDALWVPKEIAKALSNLGLGKFYPCLKRVKPIPKASYCKPSERPTAMDHFISVDSCFCPNQKRLSLSMML